MAGLGGTALMNAAAHGTPEVVQILLEAGADTSFSLLCEGEFAGYDAKKWAEWHGKTEIVQILEQHGA